MSKSDKTESNKAGSNKTKSKSKSKPKRKSKIFQLFHGTKSSSEPPTPREIPSNDHHRNSASSLSQFDRLKAIISSIFPKKTVRVKPKPRKQRSNSFTFRRSKDKKDKNITKLNKKTKSKNNNKNKHRDRKKKHSKTMSCNLPSMSSTNNNNNNNNNNMLSIRNTNWLSETDITLNDDESDKLKSKPKPKPNQKKHFKANSMIQAHLKGNILEEIIEEQNDDNIDDISQLSETEEYKGCDYDICSVPTSKIQLAPKSSSFMRSFEKRPEYTTYYPPPSLIEAFNTITVNEEERSITVETKSGIKTRLDSVDQLFELASSTLDYSNFYGYLPDQIHPIIDHNDHPIINDLNDDENNDYGLNEPTLQINDISILSSSPDDDDDYDEKYQDNLSWQ